MKRIVIPFKIRIFTLLNERERNDHMTLIKILGEVEGQMERKTTLRKLFGYGKRHENKRDVEEVNSSKGPPYGGTSCSPVWALCFYIYIYILIILSGDLYASSNTLTICAYLLLSWRALINASSETILTSTYYWLCHWPWFCCTSIWLNILKPTIVSKKKQFSDIIIWEVISNMVRKTQEANMFATRK